MSVRPTGFRKGKPALPIAGRHPPLGSMAAVAMFTAAVLAILVGIGVLSSLRG